MKFTNRLYAKILLDALENKSVHEKRSIFRRFLYILYKNGAFKNLPIILKEFEAENYRRVGLKKVELESADALSPQLLTDIKSIFSNKVIVYTKVKPEILAGLKIILDNELLIDASAKSRVDKIFNQWI